MTRRKRWAFSVVFAVLLAVMTLAGIEVLSSFHAPSWPAYALRSVPPANPITSTTRPFTAQRWIAEPYNSWGMRDVERTVAKPAGGPPRVAFIGDSFVESMFTPLSLPADVERQAAAAGHPIEAVNLGVGATDPRSYYYRIRDVALKLSPDALAVFIYTGNDIMPAGSGYSIWPSLIDESPGGSLIGKAMPRTNWLLVNRFRMSGLLRGEPPPPDEAGLLHDYGRLPPAEAVQRFVSHVKRYYYPNLSEEKIREVLTRGDGRFWRTAEDNLAEQEYLFSWALDQLVNWETRDFDVPKDRADAPRVIFPGQVEATLSWIEGMGRLARSRNVPLVVFLVPVGSVDPDYVEFWKPWPRAYSWSHICDEMRSQLASLLGKTGVRFVDLGEALDGIPGTYRKLDGHWTRKGEEIVAARVAEELGSLLGQSSRGRYASGGKDELKPPSTQASP
jgi:hypothetical protein